MDSDLEVKSRPIEHYILSIFSLLVQGKEKIRLKAYGRAIGRTIDIVNLLNQRITPDLFDIKLQCKSEKTKIVSGERLIGGPSISSIIATLEVKK